MTEEELPVCCASGHWIIRDPIKRLREVRRRGFSPLPRCAVCSTCGTVIYIDPGKPDEEFLRRKKLRQQRRAGVKVQTTDESVGIPEDEEREGE